MHMTFVDQPGMTEPHVQQVFDNITVSQCNICLEQGFEDGIDMCDIVEMLPSTAYYAFAGPDGRHHHVVHHGLHHSAVDAAGGEDGDRHSDVDMPHMESNSLIGPDPDEIASDMEWESGFACQLDRTM